MNGSISGRVVEDNGAVIPDVLVRVTRLREEVCHVLTDDCGEYQSFGLKPDIYDIEFYLRGFVPTLCPHVRIGPGEHLRLRTTSLVPSGPVARVMVPLLPSEERAPSRESATALRPEVLAFARLMESKLRVHDAGRGATGWKTATPWDLWRWLDREVGELRLADRNGDLAAIGREAADVANFAMMLADVRGAL